jgi:hypothetical protein
MKRVYTLVAAVVLIVTYNTGYCQLILTNAASSDTIDFSSNMQTSVGSNPSTAYTADGFDANPTNSGMLNSNAWSVTGWSVDGVLAFGGTKNTVNTTYTRGPVGAAPNSPGFYAYTGSPASSSDPIFLIQPGGLNFAPGTLTLRVLNSGTTNITSLDVAYDLYVRNDQFRSNSFNFSYSTDDTTYTAISSLDYTSTANPNALGLVLVGTSPSRSTTITGLNVAPNSYIYLRWSSNDVGGSGSRDEFGLDNITVSATFAAVALPIKLISFDGIHSSKGIELRWKIACGHSLDHFDVEKASDGQPFTTITQLKAKSDNCTGEADFAYTDASFSGSAAYRLQMHELNGEISISQTKYFKTAVQGTDVTILPNPALNELRVLGLTKGDTWNIIDSYGRKAVNGIATSNEDIVSVSSLAPGLYFFVSPSLAKAIQFLKL